MGFTFGQLAVIAAVLVAGIIVTGLGMIDPNL
jgi:hypothetical protein